MVELFKIGFLPITLLDILDIAVVTFIIYKLYNAIKGTIAAQIFLGLIAVLALSFLAQVGNLKALGWLLRLVTDIWVIAFIILFQPELRRLLILVGRNPFLKLFRKGEKESVPDILADTAFELAQHQHGALIVLVKSVGIRGIVETGEVINAKVSKNLLRSIFYPSSPLHDGAVVIKNDIIQSAACTLPLTQRTSVEGMSLGMRHRAGLGISEQADVISLIVSEETGGISLAIDGELKQGLSKEALKKMLTIAPQPAEEKGWRAIFEQFSRQK